MSELEIVIVDETPTPITSGKFALYKTPKGGLHLSLQVTGEAEDRHFEVPKKLMALMKLRGVDFDAVG